MATGDKLVTVAQAAKYLGITPQGPTSTGSKLVTMGQLKSVVDGSAPSGGEKLVTMSQLKRYVESVVGGGGGSSTVLYEGGGREQVSLQLAVGEYDYLEVVFGWNSATGYITNNSWSTQSVMTRPSGGVGMGYRATFDTSYNTKLLKIRDNSSYSYVDIYKVTGYKN